MGNINKRHEMPLHGVLVVELFDVWVKDFKGPFTSSFGNLYILLAVDYVSKWVEAIACPRNDASTIVNFMQKHISADLGHQEPLSVMRATTLQIDFLQG